MDFLPFSSVDEARDNAELLCRAFSFCSVGKKNETGLQEYLGLQQTRNLIAKILGFARWEDLTSRLGKGAVQVRYINQTSSPNETQIYFAEKIISFIQFDSPVDKVARALKISGFGTDYQTRNLTRGLFYNKLVDKLEKFQELQTISETYRYHSRYNQGRSAREINSMERSYEKAIAKVLGRNAKNK